MSPGQSAVAKTKMDFRIRRLAFAVLLCLPWSSLASALENSAAQEKNRATPQERSVSDLLADLSSSQYSQRKQAFQELWKLPPQELDRLFEQSPPRGPSEIALRNWLKLLQRMDASPETAAQMIDNLARMRSGDLQTVVRLARESRWSDLMALLSMLSPEDRLRMHSEPEESSSLRIELLTLAWDDSKYELIPALVDQLWEPNAAASARLQWKTHGFDELARAPIYAVDSVPTQPKAGELPTLQQRNSVPKEKLLELEVHSQAEEAISQAIQHQQFAAAEDIALRAARWDLVPTFATRLGLATNSENLKLKPRSISGGIQAIERAKEALLAQWSGRVEIADQLLNAIGDPGLELTDVEGITLALAVGGRPDQAITILEKRMPDEAFATYWVQEKIIPAFRVLGMKVSENSDGSATNEPIELQAVEAWLNTELAKEVRNSEEDISRTKKLAEVGSLLARIGKPDHARLVDDAVILWATDPNSHGESAKSDANASRHDTSDDDQRSRWKVVMRTWLLHHRRPLALKQFQTLVEDSVSDELQQAVLDELYPSLTFPNLTPIVWDVLMAFSSERNGNRIQASKDLERFAWGLAPDDWSGRWDVGGFARIASKILPKSKRELSESELPFQLARLAIEHSRYDLAQQWIEALLPIAIVEKTTRSLASLPSVYEPNLHYTREELRTNGLVEYLQILQEIYEAKKDLLRLQAVTAILHKAEPDVGSMIYRADCLRRLGNRELAMDLDQLAKTTPLTPEIMYGVQQRLDQSKLYSAYASVSKATSLSMSITHPNYWFLSSQWFYAQQRIIDQDREQPKLNEAEMLQTLQDSLHAGRLHLWSRLNAYPIRVPDFHYCLFIIERLHRLEARLAIDSGDWKSANEAVEKCWRANPDQIETLLELIPVARLKFEPEKVESWIRLYADPLENHLKLFPDDTLVGNNVAWLYANLDYRLERAKQLSTRVTEILVDDHMYLDTLGEVEFRLGNRSRAIEIARQCQKLAPREAHYHRQLKRYLFGVL
ncbi:MAG: hypothetical protein NTW52_07320 [Planctomycetota bacterium]|nr:hypothetical protein [Planctomycetota bacterium]